MNERAHPDREELRKFVQGLLSEDAMTAINAHLAGCEECLKAIDSFSEKSPRISFPQNDLKLTKLSARKLRDDLARKVFHQLQDQAPEYRKLELHGGGGMGIVLLGERDATQAGGPWRVGLKVFDEDYASLCDVSVQSLRHRFRREFEILSRLNHPAIIRVYRQVQVSETTELFEMEWVDGASLYELLRSRPATEREARGWARTLLLALGAVHTAGVLHRDVKPGNCLIDLSGNLRLIDFGLARQVGDQEAEELTRLTMASTFLGTLRFASPEQRANPMETDVRDDLYSVGMTILWALATPEGRDAKHFPESTLRRISPKFRGILQKMIASPRDARYRSAQEALSAVNVLRDEEPTRGRRRWLVLAAAAGVLSGVAGMWRLQTSGSVPSPVNAAPVVRAEGGLQRFELGQADDLAWIEVELRASGARSQMSFELTPLEKDSSTLVYLRNCPDCANEVVLREVSGEQVIVNSRLASAWTEDWHVVTLLTRPDHVELLLDGRRLVSAEETGLGRSPAKVTMGLRDGSFEFRRVFLNGRAVEPWVKSQMKP